MKKYKCIRILLIFIVFNSCLVSGKNKILTADFDKNFPVWIQKRGKWTIKDKALQSIGSVNRASLFLTIKEKSFGDFELNFDVKFTGTNIKNKGHIGIMLEDVDRKATESRFYCNGTIIMAWDTTNGKRRDHGLLGKLSNPIKINSNSPWTHFQIIREGQKVSIYENKVLVGIRNNIAPQKVKIKLYCYNLDIRIDNIKISSPDSLKNIKDKEPKFKDPSYIVPPPQKKQKTASNAFRILYVGNSITRHGIAMERLKWDHIAGMAASKETNDFAHLLAKYIQKTMPKRKVEIYFADVNRLRNRGKSTNPLAKNIPHPHLVVIQTGEHEGPKRAITEVTKVYDNFIIKPFYQLAPRPLILCTGLWYTTNGTPYRGWVSRINNAYRDVCSKYNIPFVSVESLAGDPSCRGWGKHPGVKWHPNDKGMKGYADLLFKAYRKAKGSNIVPKSLKANKPVVISEDFSKKKSIGENFNINPRYWKISDGVLKTINGMKGMRCFSIPGEKWQDYEIEFKVKRIKLNPKGQHFGIFVRCDDKDLSKSSSNLRLYSWGGGVTLLETMEKRKTRHTSLGCFSKEMPVGPDAPWASFRITVKGKEAKVYKDNVLVGTVNNVVPQKGSIVFYAYNLDLYLDDFKVLVTKSSDNYENTSCKISNILNNSSFEQCTLDKLPDYWGCEHFGIVDPYWVVNYDKWLNSYGVDTHCFFDGKQSMRISNPLDKNVASALCLKSVCLGASVNKKYTFSAYMKSQSIGMKVSFNGKEIALTDKWKRYSNIFINNGKNVYSDMVKIYPLEKGTFWIDAVQLEEGENLTDYHRSASNSALQVQEGNPNKLLSEVPKLETKKLDGKINLDGRLNESVWNKAEKLNLVNINGQAATEKTEARVWYNDEGIYIGIKCFDEKASKNVCTVKTRDDNVWNDPSIELFIDPQLTRNYYYHFGVNQNGTQFDAHNGDVSWNGLWKAATYTDRNGKYWSVETFLPFGEMGISRVTGEWWGLNVCRSNNNKKEFNSWSPTYGGFHTPTRFGQIKINQKTMDTYLFSCDKVELENVGNNTSSLSVKIINNSPKNGEYVLSSCLLDEKGKQAGVFESLIKLDKSEQKNFIMGKVKGKRGAKYNLRLKLYSKNKQKIYYSENKFIETLNYISIMPQYDLYTSENKIWTKVRLNLSAKDLNNAKLELKISTSNGNAVLKKELLNLKREMDITLSIKDLPLGNYSLKAHLKNKQEITLSKLNKKFRKLPPMPNEVKIDHISRMVVVEGKHFMPLGFAWEGKLTPGVMEYLSNNGVNSIAFWAHDNYSKTKSVLDNAGKVGIKVRVGVLSRDKVKVTKFIEHFKRHPALLAWDIFDEVFTVPWGKNNYQLISDRCDELKLIDPYHPVFINENQYGLSYLKNKNLIFPGDIVSVDYYAWTPSGNIPITSKYVQTMKAMGQKDGKPNWLFLLGAGYSFWSSRDYTPAEQEFSTYATVINGGSGVYYWASHPKSNSQWKRIKRLLRELKELTPIVASPLKSPAIKCSAPSIEFLIKKNKKCVYIIAVNNSRKTVDARFDLSSLKLQDNSKLIKVFFEKRQIKIKNDIIEDKFKGFQRHVYCIETDIKE